MHVLTQNHLASSMPIVQGPNALPTVLLVGHGTRLAAGLAEFATLAAQLRQALPERSVHTAFLELAAPDITTALEQLWQQGVRRITVLPALLLAAGHLKHDIPALLEAARTRHPELTIILAAELGVHAHLLHVAATRIAATEATFASDYRRQDSLLLVVGRGGTDPDANANVARATRLLGETLGFAWMETAYASRAMPSVEQALEQLRRLEFPQLLVLPYLLFAGRLARQIAATVAAFQQRYDQPRLALASYLNADPGVVATLLARLDEAESGRAPPNCWLCPNRARRDPVDPAQE